MNLELSADACGLRHYLNGRPVHCGTGLLLAIHPENCQPEQWAPARYEANLDRDRVNVTLHTHFGVVLPNRDTRLRWPNDGGSAPLRVKQTALKVKTPELPVELHAKLAEHRCKYTDLVSLYYAFCFETDCWAGVVGDGDNGAYEWFLSTPNGVQVSDSGYGDSLLALRDVLNKVVI